ncbi:MAG TPA: DUF4097 family beta strand repeat-containing protein, partial [Fimbriimonas sp.]
EVQRITKLVAEGKLSPEDAADLIEAFSSGEGAAAAAGAAATETAEEPMVEEAEERPKDPLKSIVDSFEKLLKEGKDSVNWDEVGKQAKQAAKQAAEKIKTGVEEISKGKVNIGFFGAQATREVTLPLTLAEGQTLRIDNPCGSVKVVGGFDVGSVKADAKFRGTFEDAKAKADAYTIIIEESDHQVMVKQPDVVGLCVDLEVQMPGTGWVEIRSESGDVEVIDTKAGARISTRSGDVKLRGLQGATEVSCESGDVVIQDSTAPSIGIENKSGDITIRRVQGNINARTAAGDVVVESCSGKVVSVESVSGNVHVDVEEPVSGSLNIRTVNGHANVSVPDGSDCRVSLSTLRGGVTCTLALEDEASTDQRITGRLGAGVGTLDVSAVTGSITLEMHDATVKA